jgi:two-component sensor histidine kinase
MQPFFSLRLAALLLALAWWPAGGRAQPLTPAGADSLEAVFRGGGAGTGRRQILPPRGSPVNRIRRLLERGKTKLRPTYTRPADRAGALLLFGQAAALSESLGDDAWRQECQALIGVTHLLNNDWARGKDSFMRVIGARRRAGDRAGEMRAWLRMVTTTFCDDCRENLFGLDQALALSRQLGDPAWEALIRMEIGYKHLNAGNIPRARQEALRALRIQDKIGFAAINRVYHALAGESVYYPPSDYGYLSNAYYLLSDLSQVNGDLNQKLYFILEVVKGMERSGMTDELEYAYFRLGNAYWELEQFDKSMAYHRQSLAVSRRKGQSFIQVGLVRRMVTALLKGGRVREALGLLLDVTQKDQPFTYEEKTHLALGLGACYGALRQPARAEQYYLDGVAWSRHAPVHFRHVAWRGISTFYVENGQYAEAGPYLKRLLAASPQQVIPSHRLQVHLMLFKVDSARGDFRSAIEHYQRYKTLNDSVFNERKSKQIAQLSIQYETEKKEQALQLKEKNIALLTAQSRSQQTQRNALIGGTGLLLALLGLGYNRYRFKLRSNQQLKAHQHRLQAQHEELQAQQEELQARQQEINRKNQDLQGLLEEKERLLKEIHHRVKNNLQVVMSLLSSQARYLSDEKALTAIRESQHRVQAMALIHQKLYQAEGVARIPMKAYVEEVVAYLHDAYGPAGNVQLHLSVEPTELDVIRAVPLGLIINEAVSNAFKYAFPGGRPGTVRLSLRESGGVHRLVIADDGVGLPPHFDFHRSHSLGMTLLHGFGQQLGGKVSITSPPGTTLCLVFGQEQ